jgi:hypothetical protein
MSTQERPSGEAPQWPFDAPSDALGPPPLPDPSGVQTAAELRSAVAEILRHHDLGVISARMRVSLSTVRLVSRWPDQVDLATFCAFLRACGAGAEDERAWVAVWRRLGGANLSGTAPDGRRLPEYRSPVAAGHGARRWPSGLEITVPAAVALALTTLALLAALLLWIA